jgi:hypothetical protein
MGGLDMSHSLDFNIHIRLIDYLAGEITLRDFEDWFFSETWDVDQKRDLALVGLVYAIKLCLAEFSNGDWTEDELRGLLKSLQEKHFLIAPQVQQVQVTFGTSSTNSQVTSTVTSSVQYVDIKLLTVSV